MSVQPREPDPSSPLAGDGVRVHRRPDAGGGWQRRLPIVVVLLALAVIVVWQWRGPAASRPAVAPVVTASAEATDSVQRNAAPPVPALQSVQASPRPLGGVTRSAAPAGNDEPVAGLDPDDLANYVSPDDPEPSMKEVIDALHEAGIRTGLGAFNPPGTSPPLPGIAVPEDFDLPEGYVRHHQVTDAGEPIEPILMFSPDFDFRDAGGRLITLPEDMVVPPELAPPGLPIRPVEIPPPP